MRASEANDKGNQNFDRLIEFKRRLGSADLHFTLLLIYRDIDDFRHWTKGWLAEEKKVINQARVAIDRRPVSTLRQKPFLNQINFSDAAANGCGCVFVSTNRLMALKPR